MKKILPVSLIPDDGSCTGIEKFSITYVQPADTNSPSGENQFLTIDAISSVDSVGEYEEKGEPMYYFNISTSKWSVDKPEDVTMLLEDFKRRLSIETKYW